MKAKIVKESLNEERAHIFNVLDNIEQQPQVQYSLGQQLFELRMVANKLGLYDAAEWLNKAGAQDVMQAEWDKMK
jgi:hypothetical protein